MGQQQKELFNGTVCAPVDYYGKAGAILYSFENVDWPSLESIEADAHAQGNMLVFWVSRHTLEQYAC